MAANGQQTVASWAIATLLSTFSMTREAGCGRSETRRASLLLRRNSLPHRFTTSASRRTSSCWAPSSLHPSRPVLLDRPLGLVRASFAPRPPCLSTCRSSNSSAVGSFGEHYQCVYQFRCIRGNLFSCNVAWCKIVGWENEPSAPYSLSSATGRAKRQASRYGCAGATGG